MPNKVKIYACGGAATNIVSAFFDKEQHLIIGGADLDVAYIDTARSNTNPAIKPEQLYIVDTPESKNGSGKDRTTNAKPIKESVPDILLQFPSEKFNIVVASTMGGSGSVAAPYIVSELLARGQNVILISVGVGAFGSKKEVQNSIKTIESYEGITKVRGRPLAMAYFDNATSRTCGKTDQRVMMMLKILSVLLSGHNHGMDDQDVSNFLDYQRVTSFEPHLTYLDVFQEKVEISKGSVAVTVASLTVSGTAADLEVPVSYQCEGIVPSHAVESIGGKVPVHTAIIAGHFSIVLSDLKAKVAAFEAAEKAAMSRSVKVEGDTDDAGISL